MQEYFEHGYTNDVAEILRGLNLGERKSTSVGSVLGIGGKG